MFFRFRTKVLAIAGTASLGVALLVATDIFVAHGVSGELTQIRNTYIPLMGLGERLSVKFENLSRALQDAVAARDPDILESTDTYKNILLDEIDKNVALTDVASVSALRKSITDYYGSAYDISRRLMANETGVQLVEDLKEMQIKRQQVITLMKKAFLFDKEKLGDAFSAIGKLMTQTSRVQRFTGFLCILIVILFSFWISRDILRSLLLLTKGLARFGEGDFSQSIPAVSRDELGEVAQQANQMAHQIQTLLDELKEKSLVLQLSNKELEAFSYSVAHDLRAPVRAMIGFSHALVEDHGAVLPTEAIGMIERISAAGKKMGLLIDGLLSLSQMSRKDLVRDVVDVSAIAEATLKNLQESAPQRKVSVTIEKNLVVNGDARLLQVVFMNLLGNAWKFTAKKSEATIEFGTRFENNQRIFYVRDNGAGFDMRYVDKLFGTFQRLHSAEDFDGTGIGLATVQRIILRHGGKIWAEAAPEKGATFYFTFS